ncbi:hypothetical protein C7S15_7436 [Burkholderia cepacia]|nr:hypothetical protein [Burkholderia cepacia]
MHRAGLDTLHRKPDVVSISAQRDRSLSRRYRRRRPRRRSDGYGA